ncbi:MAG: DUF3575 domain-containing protein, partial [Prevotella sp.]|nr:DUF3575 domain-containing protein [Prevotella sp.]
KYRCFKCGSKLADETKGMFMPTKLAISFIYNIK